MNLVSSLNSSLGGSPYLLAEDEQGVARAELIASELKRIEQSHHEVEITFSQASHDVQESLKTFTRTRLVYESNALELTGLPLAETAFQIAEAPTDLDQLAIYLASKAVSSDRHLVDVLGLHGANLFVQQLATEYRLEVPISEVDIRSLHAKTVPTEIFRGQYRDRDVQISGSDHLPPPPYEVPRQMRELVDWLNKTNASPVLAATAAHSWLTIIHPFQDGNGRVARLLANLVLLRSGWPSLIVRGTDRLQYLDALSASDEAGNLLPLFDLFVKSIKRTLKEISKPGLAEKLFEADLRRSPNLQFQMWTQLINEFLEKLRASLTPLGFDLYRLTVVETSTYLLLNERDSSANTWLAKIKHTDGRDLLLWLGFMSQEMRDYGDPEIPAPSIFISERDKSGVGPHPYRSPLKFGSPVKIDEVSLIPTVRPEPVFVRYPGFVVERLSVDEAVFRLTKGIESTVEGAA